MSNLKKRIKKIRRAITYSNVFTGILAAIAVFIIKLYVRTLKITFFEHPEYIKIDKSKILFGFWHGKQFLLVPSFGSLKATIMADISWAGEIQTKILSSFGYFIIRGSSKRQSVRVLLEMKKSIENGHPGAFALDGPSGPIYKSKPGIVFLANKFDLPLIPVACSAEKFWIINNTWCNYEIPKPFSNCRISMGKPLHIDKKFTNTQLDEIMLAWNDKNDIYK